MKTELVSDKLIGEMVAFGEELGIRIPLLAEHINVVCSVHFFGHTKCKNYKQLNRTKLLVSEFYYVCAQCKEEGWQLLGDRLMQA